MTNNQIAIDFVAGTHGHFLETTLNKFFGITDDLSDSFTAAGTSHKKSREYQNNKLFHARHWFELYPAQLKNFKKIISIRFTQDDLLLVSSVSLLRAGDCNIDNDDLDVNTVSKLNNSYYQSTLAQIYHAYPFLNQTDLSIPRYVLREFYKFGFKNPEVNGYWTKQKQMQYPSNCVVYHFDFDSFYNIDKFVESILCIEKIVDMQFNFSKEVYQQHEKFLSFIPYINHKSQCDQIINQVCNEIEVDLPKLSLFQESYINGCLENIYGKEMPFQQDRYFTSTKDMLYYINNLAPNL